MLTYLNRLKTPDETGNIFRKLEQLHRIVGSSSIFPMMKKSIIDSVETAFLNIIENSRFRLIEKLVEFGKQDKKNELLAINIISSEALKLRNLPRPVIDIFLEINPFMLLDPLYRNKIPELDNSKFWLSDPVNRLVTKYIEQFDDDIRSTALKMIKKSMLAYCEVYTHNVHENFEYEIIMSNPLPTSSACEVAPLSRDSKKCRKYVTGLLGLEFLRKKHNSDLSQFVNRNTFDKHLIVLIAKFVY